MAVPLARARGAAVHVLHVVERDVVAGEDAVDLETRTTRRATLLDACVAELREAGVPVDGRAAAQRRHHADVARQILRRAAELGGSDRRRPRQPAGGARRRRDRAHRGHAPCRTSLVVNPRAGAVGAGHR